MTTSDAPTSQALDPADMDRDELVRAHRKLRSAYASASAERDRLAAKVQRARDLPRYIIKDWSVGGLPDLAVDSAQLDAALTDRDAS